MSTRPSLTPLADLGRSAGQAPLHRLYAARVGAADDDAEVDARLIQRVRIEVSLGGRLGADVGFWGRKSCARPEHYRFWTPTGHSAHTTARWKRGIIRPLHE